MKKNRAQEILEKLADRGLELARGERPGTLQRLAYRATKTKPYRAAEKTLREGNRGLQRGLVKARNLPSDVATEYRGWKKRVDRGLDETAKTREEIKKSRETADRFEKRFKKGGLLGGLF